MKPYRFYWSRRRDRKPDAGFIMFDEYASATRLMAELRNEPVFFRLMSQAMRYSYLYIYPEGDDAPRADVYRWQGLMNDLGHFRDGPGWYSFIQIGSGESPLVFGELKCKTKKEALSVARAREKRAYIVPKKDIETMKARIALIGQARSEA